MCARTTDELTVEQAIEKLSLYDDLFRATEYLARCLQEQSPFLNMEEYSVEDIIPFNASIPTAGMRDALTTLALCRRLETQIKNKIKHVVIPLIPLTVSVIATLATDDSQC